MLKTLSAKYPAWRATALGGAKPLWTFVKGQTKYAGDLRFDSFVALTDCLCNLLECAFLAVHIQNLHRAHGLWAVVLRR